MVPKCAFSLCQAGVDVGLIWFNAIFLLFYLTCKFTIMFVNKRLTISPDSNGNFAGKNNFIFGGKRVTKGTPFTSKKKLVLTKS
jgi:hypothetical protein